MYPTTKKIELNASIRLMHRLLYVHSRFIRSVVVSYIFLCTPDNSTMQSLFHWLFLYTAIVEPLKTCFIFKHIVQGLRHLACAIHGDVGNSLDVCVGWTFWSWKWFHLLIFQALHMCSHFADWWGKRVWAALIWMSENTIVQLLFVSYVSRSVWTQYTVAGQCWV